MKNLENEYRQLTAAQVPDLWDRIEAGIDKIEQEKKTEEKVIEITDIKKKKNNIVRYVPVIAAAAALMITYGVYTSMQSNKSDTSNVMSFAPMADSAPAAEATADDASETYAEAACDEAPAMEMETEEISAAEEIQGIRGDASEDAAEELTREYTGLLIYCDNPQFVEIELGENDLLRLYIPEELSEAVDDAIAVGYEVKLEYELLDEEIISTFDAEYSDVNWYISGIEMLN